jgi:MoaA/NifB/PqqE/SkfB family radical SAM enzyme
MNILDIKKIELEITSNCNAACPGCARTQRSDLLDIKSFTLEDLQNIFPTKQCIEGKIFKFCGVLGDPVMNPDCLDMIKYLVQHGGWCQISTNAALQTVSWWQELGKLSSETNAVDVSFCVDGHRETNHIYRVNTKFDTIERNMQAYYDGGNGKVSGSWIYIVFDHNEYELPIAKEHAARLGLNFAVRTGMRNSYSGWVSVVRKRNAETNKLENQVELITTTGSKEHVDKEKVLQIDDTINNFNTLVLNKPESLSYNVVTKDEKKYKPIKIKRFDELKPIEASTPEQIEALENLKELARTITCKMVHEQELFIASNMTLWPCCFLWDSWFVNKDDIRTRLGIYDEDWNNLTKHSIDDILAHPWFEKALELSWDPTHNQHINRCIKTCALNKAYQNKLEFQKSLESQPINEEKKHNNNLSCNHLTNHLAIVSSDGMISPCCQFEDKRKKKFYKTIWNTSALNPILKTPFWKEIREELENNNKIYNCKSCWKSEESGSESKRIWINKITEPTFPVRLEDLEIGLDYTCNMMCRICKPNQSSKWNSSKVAKELYARRPAIYASVENPKKYQEKIKEVLENSYLGHIKRVRLVGGEPFYSKNFEWFMEKLCSSTDISSLHFAVNTNGSILPKSKILEYMFRMKSVSIDFSIDAIGELATTTRYGIDWEVIEQNINTWIELSKKYSNIKLKIHSTLSILNINKVQPIIDFCDLNNIHFGYSVLSSPDYLDFRQIPIEERLKWVVSSSTQPDYSIKDVNKSILSQVKVNNKLYEFIYFNELMDNYQQKHFANVNPEIIQLAEKYKNE